jgi:hypothetical protein
MLVLVCHGSIVTVQCAALVRHMIVTDTQCCCANASWCTTCLLFMHTRCYKQAIDLCTSLDQASRLQYTSTVLASAPYNLLY